MYVYMMTGANLWTVGFFMPDGTFRSESDHESADNAGRRVHYLNGGSEGAVKDLAAPLGRPAVSVATIRVAGHPDQGEGMMSEMNAQCGQPDCDCGHTIERLRSGEGYAAALDRLQERFNEVWKQHQGMLLALENARDVVHRTHCLTPGFPSECWKECREAMDAMLEAGWMPLEAR
jgi:hypothetical protein